MKKKKQSRIKRIFDNVFVIIWGLLTAIFLIFYHIFSLDKLLFMGLLSYIIFLIERFYVEWKHGA